MVQIILVLLVLLWLTGFIHIPVLNASLFSIAAHPFTLQSLLFLILIIWVISLLPGIFRTILTILFVLWLLSAIGLFAGLSHIIILLLILVIVFSFV